ncbi:MAG TPA: PepSY domain-containing protein [Gemmatimonadaceae bacterium]|jgi:uncharacterized membrane protein YkoI
MKARLLLTLTILTLANRSDAQTSMRVSGGEVSRSSARVDVARLAARIPGIDGGRREQIHVSGDSAQRIAMNDFEWHGSVTSIEFDEQDARVFWDVKIVPDTSQQTIVRYRIDATNGGILDIKEFTGIRGLARRKP